MSYKLGFLPSIKATIAEMADFMEYECLMSGEDCFSVVSAKSAMGISSDEDRSLEDSFPEVDDALYEVEKRSTNSKMQYPFETTTNSIRVRQDVDGRIKDVYTFLLLSTRADMSVGKIAGGIDGTALFEKLCASVLGNYFGASCQSFVFGTGQDGNESFEEKVQKMLNRFDEGKLTFRSPDNDSRRQKDGKLDVVAFIPFADKRKGQFIAFGQCKTGTNWQASISQLNPKSFCELYSGPVPGFTPIAIFMVAEAFTESWEALSRSSNGILFDRTRIMNYLPQEIDETLLGQIRQWNSAVIERSKPSS